MAEKGPIALRLAAVGQPAVKFSRKTLLYSGLESAGEGVANVVVDRQQLLTGEGHRGDTHDRNERGDQAIFDGGDTGFVFDETGEEGLHRKDPFRGSLASFRWRRWKDTIESAKILKSAIESIRPNGLGLKKGKDSLNGLVTLASVPLAIPKFVRARRKCSRTSESGH
jgi:hypothetical protein